MSGRSQDFYEPERERAATRINDPHQDFGPGRFTQESLPAVIPMQGHGPMQQAGADIITAQRVAIKRDLPRILREIDEAAEVGAGTFYYSWPTKNGDGTMGVVEGPSIDCAMALVSIWGNCRIEAFPATETQSHWVFMARFTDFEKGVTVVRSFQQRRAQSTGKRMDAARAEDIAFQIGQSKAMRNAVVAGLKMYADRAVRSAKSSAYAWVEKNLEKARAVVLELAVTLRVPTTRMELATGRKSATWLAADLIALRSKLLSIQDGFDDVDTAFPSAEAVAGEASVEAAQTIPPKTEPQQQPPKEQPARAARAASGKRAAPAAAPEQPAIGDPEGPPADYERNHPARARDPEPSPQDEPPMQEEQQEEAPPTTEDGELKFE